MSELQVTLSGLKCPQSSVQIVPRNIQDSPHQGRSVRVGGKKTRQCTWQTFNHREPIREPNIRYKLQLIARVNNSPPCVVLISQ